MPDRDSAGTGLENEPIGEPLTDGAAPRDRRWRQIARSLRSNRTAVVGGILVVFWIVTAVAWQWMVPYDPRAVLPAETLAPPGADHWFGTDTLGRDVLSRVLAGAAPVLSVAPLATILALILGTTLGLLTGYFRGAVDEILMRIMDALLAFPVVIVAVVVLGLLGASRLNLVLVIAILFSPHIARTMRSAVLAERQREYVAAAQLRGESSLYVMIVEILPNVLPPLIVEGSIRVGYAVFTAATLSFLGLGLQPPSPDWGLTVAMERTSVQIAPWTVLFPAGALASLVVGINLFTDGLRRAIGLGQ